ncbi:MAG: N-acetyltransferase [Verrucomicrobia bacterium]|nr:N-acetyltransferase [Verrucomicrobiota bacterium]
MNDIFIHPQAIVESDRIGAGTRIWAFAHVMKGAVIGSNCNIGNGVFVEGGARIGSNVTIKNQCLIWEGVTIEDNAFIGPNVVFTNDARPRSPRLDLVRERYATKGWVVPTLIREGASIGAGVSLVCGITVGEYAMVGTGAVVARNVPPYALVYGVPARIMATVCRCGLTLQFQRAAATCEGCGNRYQRDTDTVKWLGPKIS